tara:strand:+ start:160 stop:576 length:417 start_codon:yes stop_codon:yes gene_type:complete
MENTKDFKKKLRSAGLRPTKQRLSICNILFNRKQTFHFSVEELKDIIEKVDKSKVSLATIYNTINAFKNKGYLKKISINSDKSYFDTNTKNHHHFYDEDTKELIDLHDKDVQKIKINKSISGKKITSIEVLVKVANSN